MTAVISILNKGCIALAADSAVTVSHNTTSKVYNNANKIFALSDYNPVGIMLFNNSQFSGVPWEVIIKEFRKKLKHESYNHLYEYKDAFLKYLNSDESIKKHSFDTVELRSIFVINGLLGHIVPQVFRNSNLEFHEEFISQIKAKIDKIEKQTTPCKSLEEYTKDVFKSKHHNSIKSQLSNIAAEKFKIFSICDTRCKKEFIPPSFTDIEVDLLMDLVYLTVVSASISYDNLYTGLVICGYGAKELYPSQCVLYVSHTVDTSIKYWEEEVTCITEDNSVSIKPYAQTDVIETILWGMNNELFNAHMQIFSEYLDYYKFKIQNEINSKYHLNIELGEGVSQEEITEFRNALMDILITKYQDPIRETVSSLSKEDLAEVAENLIYLTYLNRRMTFSGEGVGGPVDVAVITKGDGFVWLKRKHYFNSELNPNFSKIKIIKGIL